MTTKNGFAKPEKNTLICSIKGYVSAEIND